MNIGDASRRTGLPVKTIRYYEEIGLVNAMRSENGYRQFGAVEVHKLRFVQRARSLGFSVDDCRALLALYENRERSSAEVKGIANKHLADIDAKIVELENLREVLGHLVDHCAGDDRPNCPIIDDLAALPSILNQRPEAPSLGTATTVERSTAGSRPAIDLFYDRHDRS